MSAPPLDRRARRAQARAATVRRRRRAAASGLVALAVTALVVGLLLGAGHHTTVTATAVQAAGATPAASAPRQAAPTPPTTAELSRIIGARIVSPMDGTEPSSALLHRARAGTIGGVVLFGRNITSATQVRRAVARLQAAAKAGGNPPLLIMADQEGGPVKRFASIGPDRAPRKMGSTQTAGKQGAATADGLKHRGVTVDLAPLGDVTSNPGSFLYQRTFPGGAAQVGELACAFAQGLRTGGITPTLKHFPGLGGATTNTDDANVTLDTPLATLQANAGAYKACGTAQTLVMIASASYRALGAGPAVLNPKTYALLRRLGAQSPTISDDLEAAALRGRSHVATRAVQAGLDVLLYAQSESAAINAHTELMRAEKAGDLDPLALLATRDRIAALR
jgi:beta-N-acetylhexosaminidase